MAILPMLATLYCCSSVFASQAVLVPFVVPKAPRSSLLEARAKSRSHTLLTGSQHDIQQTGLLGDNDIDAEVHEAHHPGHSQKRPPGLRISAQDQRNYQLFTLQNGLRTVLISDPEATQAAASMDCGNGYFSDPEDVPGLAHFLEHMLFLGTIKYPDEAAYDEFLGAHGGNFNAYTSDSNTNFYFGVDPLFLKPTLDRFAQFFVSPLFTESATSREINAVDHENGKNLQVDGYRFAQLQNHLANPKSPFHKFGTGNLATLGALPPTELRERLISTWKQHYVADNLRLVVIGRESLSDLQTLVTDIFSDVPTGTEATAGSTNLGMPSQARPTEAAQKPRQSQDPDSISAESFLASASASATSWDHVFSPSVLGHKIYFRTVDDTRSLYLMWPLPPQRKFYNRLSMYFIQLLLGAANKEGLRYLLKDRGLASSVDVGGQDVDTSFFYMASVSFSLTEAGMRDPDAVVECFYAWLRVVQSDGVKAWRYAEAAIMAQLEFDYKDKEAATDYATSIAESMRHHADIDILSAGSLMEEFNAEDIHALLRLLTPHNMIMFIASQQPVVATPLREPWYGVEYGIAPMVSHYSTTPTIAAHLSLPGKNPFLPTKLALAPRYTWPAALPVSPSRPSNLLLQTSLAPSLIWESTEPVVRLWFQQDTEFHKPNAILLFRLWSEEGERSPRSVVLINMLLGLLNTHLEAFSYLPAEAGLSFKLHHTDGIQISISGYTQFLESFASAVLDKLLPGVIKFQPQRFGTLKERMLETYRNAKFRAPNKYADFVAKCVLYPENAQFQPSRMARALDSITLADVQNFHREFFGDVQMECFFGGNMLPTTAKSLLQKLLSKFPFQTTSTSLSAPETRNIRPVPSERISRLAPAFHHTVQTVLPNPDDENSVVLNYYQHSRASPETRLYNQLLAMILEKPLYQELRTVQQLGYIVWSSSEAPEHVAGFRILVQSSTYGAAELNKRVVSALPLMRKHVQRVTDMYDDEEGSFGTFVHSLIDSNVQNFTDFTEQMGHMWSQITNRQYHFGIWEEQNAIARDKKRINREGLKRHFDELFHFVEGDFGGSLSVQIEAQKHHSSKASSLVSVPSFPPVLHATAHASPVLLEAPSPPAPDNLSGKAARKGSSSDTTHNEKTRRQGTSSPPSKHDFKSDFPDSAVRSIVTKRTTGESSVEPLTIGDIQVVSEHLFLFPITPVAITPPLRPF